MKMPFKKLPSGVDGGSWIYYFSDGTHVGERSATLADLNRWDEHLRQINENPRDATGDVAYDFEAASLCGDNHDPSLVRFARKCIDYGKRRTDKASRTYGELPNAIQSLIQSHEWDNMSISEQRDWCIGIIAAAALAGH